MREITALAQGTKLKEGACRRIVVTMDEKTFLQIKTVAMREDRSISGQIFHYIRAALTSRRLI